MRISRKRPIAEEYVWAHKDWPTNTIAKLMFEENPGIFPSLNAASCHIRSVRGARGVPSKRNHVGQPVPELTRTPEEANGWMKHIYRAEPTKYKVVHLSFTEQLKYLVMGDIHHPYHAYDELICAIRYAKEQGCNAVILLGDAIDFYQMSKFNKDPRNKDVQYELDSVNSFIEAIKRALNPKRIIWKLGNHEKRFEVYMKTQAPALINLKVLGMTSMFPDPILEFVEWGNPIRMGALTLLHGDEYGGGWVSPVNPARGVFLKAHECVIVAHSHVTSEHTEGTISGRIIACWSLGCLCDLHPEYKPLNKWNHGFGILSVDKGGVWQFKNHKIIKGQVV